MCLSRQYSPDYAVEVYLKIAQLYLEVEKHVEAESYINRTGSLLPNVTDKNLLIIHKVSSTEFSVNLSRVYSFAVGQVETVSPSTGVHCSIAGLLEEV